ncbi:MAG: IPT/TIG domain-containing protein [Spirochaetales bacterium]|nr:IPT/TIG domain-containing protein [Spirochaetales bacterium]
MNIKNKKKRDIILSSSLLLVVVVLITVSLALIERPPKITSIEPSSAFPNETVKIYGNHFMDLSSGKLLYDGVEVDRGFVLSWTESEVEFLVPQDFVSGVISVQTSIGQSNSILFTNKSILPVLLTDKFYTEPVIDHSQTAILEPSSVLEVSGGFFGDDKIDADLIFRDKKGRVYLPSSDDYLLWSDSLIRVKVPPLSADGFFYLENPVGISNHVKYTLASSQSLAVELPSYSFQLNYLFSFAEEENISVVSEFYLALPSFSSRTYFYLLSDSIHDFPYYRETNYLDYYKYKKNDFSKNNLISKEFKADFFKIYVPNSYFSDNIKNVDVELTWNIKRFAESIDSSSSMLSQIELILEFLQDEADFDNRFSKCFSLLEYLGYNVEKISGLKISSGSIIETSWIEIDLKGIGQIVFDVGIRSAELLSDDADGQFFSLSDSSWGYAPVMAYSASKRRYYSEEWPYNTGGVFRFSNRNVILKNNLNLNVQHFFINRTKPET